MTEGTVCSEEARRVASQAVASGQADLNLARDRARLLDPRRIQAPDGGNAGWIVPVGLEDALLGFIQISPKGRFQRFASFQRDPRSNEGCPPLATWLDETTVLDRARTVAGQDEHLALPVLTYDRHPDRLVWAVEITSGEGGTIFVAGEAAWKSHRSKDRR